jgi:hypothetical protein
VGLAAVLSAPRFAALFKRDNRDETGAKQGLCGIDPRTLIDPGTPA